MGKRLTSAIVPLVAALLLAGCGEPQTTDDNTAAGFDPARVHPVQIVEQAMGQNETLTEPRKLVTSREQLEALGSDIALADQVDFETHNLAVVSLGEQNTGGYWVKITSARYAGDRLRIHAVANRPSDDEMQTQQLTYPYAVAILPKTETTNVDWEYEQVVGQSPGDFPVAFNAAYQAAPATQPTE